MCHNIRLFHISTIPTRLGSGVGASGCGGGGCWDGGCGGGGGAGVGGSGGEVGCGGGTFPIFYIKWKIILLTRARLMSLLYVLCLLV